jgi:hypothetical protein
VSTVSSEDDNVRSDEYWMGVRDALRMVDSFHKWSKRNPGRAKDLEDFIHDGLIAAAKRCESCLSDKLGLRFAEDADDDEIILQDPIEPKDDEEDDDDDDEKEDDITFEKSIEIDEEPEVPETELMLEESSDHVESDSVASTLEPEVPEESSISLDSVERKEDEQMGDLSIEGPPREFSTDFELVEPTPLVVDEPSKSDEPAVIEPEIEPEEIFSDSTISDEIGPAPESESEELPDKPSFTWSEYEEAVTPLSEPEPLDPEVDIIPTEDEEVAEDAEEVTDEPPDPPKVWSPYDEPSISEEISEDEPEPEIEEPEPVVAGEDETVISEPPAPPPPPESEEDEEERKRRARRLFFGA